MVDSTSESGTIIPTSLANVDTGHEIVDPSQSKRKQIRSAMKADTKGEVSCVSEHYVFEADLNYNLIV